MSEPYIGEIRMVAFNFAPQGWAFCDGSLQPINQNTTLFNLIGTTYGGDGNTTFALPDLRSRVPIHVSSSFPLSSYGGTETVTVTVNQLPAHSHALEASTTAATATTPGGSDLGASGIAVYKPPTTVVPTTTVTDLGRNLGPVVSSHENMMPFTCINFVISLYGVYPSQT